MAPPPNRRLIWLAGGLTAALMWSLAGAAAASGARQQPEAIAHTGFEERVQAYMKLREKVSEGVPATPPHPGVTPGDILARRIIQARPRAQPGDLFTSDARRSFRQQIARALAGPDGARVRASIMDENPGRIHIRVNGRYPDGIPLASMPTQVLAALPKLPTELEFRFIGRRLVLLDADANVIVDYMDNALQN